MMHGNGRALGLSLLLFFLLLPPGLVGAQELLLGDDFADASQWQKKASRHGQEIVAARVSVTIKSAHDGSRPGRFLRVEDRSPSDHWFWLQKRKAQGSWDLGGASKATLWARGNGAKSVIRFLVGDRRGNVAYYALGTVEQAGWTRLSLDLRRTLPFNAVGAVDWCSVTAIGLRTDPGHGYTFDFHDLRIESQEEPCAAGPAAEKLLHPAALEQAPLGFLASVSSRDLDDSIVGINLTGSEEDADLDRIAQAGVKWAKLSCLRTGAFAARTDRMVDALRARRIQVVGHLPQTIAFSKDLFGDLQEPAGERVPVVYGAKAMAWFRERVRETAERLKGRVRVWEIGNEPDIAKFWPPTPDPAAFGTLVIETSKVLKAVDPQNKVISGGVCGFWGVDFPGVRGFLTGFFETGAGRHIDLLGLHPYRPHPESGAPNMTQSQVIGEIRRLMSRFGLSLPVWDTEWQITGAVDRAEVPFASDLYEAKGMLRKYLTEAAAGFVRMHWQIAKARPNMDHPGQIFTADGRPTAKYVALRHTGALFARILSPVEVPLRLANRVAEPPRELLLRLGSDAPLAAADWKASAGTVAPAPSGETGALKLSGARTARVETSRRWRPPPGAAVLEVRGVLRGDGCEAAIHPAPHDELGNELPPPGGSRKPLVAQPQATPFCFRFPVGADWRDFGLRIELPRGGTAVVEDLSFVCYLPRLEVASLAFGLRGSQSPAVFFWNPAKPSERRRFLAVDLALEGMPDGEFVLLDALSGEIRRLARPHRSGKELVFSGLPVCDSPMAIVPPGVLPTSPVPAWLAVFSGADEIVNRSFQDRTGDFYLRGFWSAAFEVGGGPGLPGEARDKLDALRRVRSFWRAFSATAREIEVLTGGPSRMTVRPGPETWHDSVANPQSRHVSRFFHNLDSAHATVHGVRIADRPLPERPWADRPDRALTWFTLRRSEQPLQVFVVVPKDRVFDGRDVAIDLSTPRSAKALLLGSPAAQSLCVAYWTQPLPGQEDGPCTLQLDDPAWGASDVMIVDPRTRAVCGKATARTLGGGRVLVEAPPAPNPLLLVPRQLLESVLDAFESPHQEQGAGHSRQPQSPPS